MEVAAETPPPLPPKTKKSAEFQPQVQDAKTFTNETSILVAPQNGHEVGSLKIVNNRRHDEDDFAPPQSLRLSEKRVTDPQSDKVSADGRLSLTSDKKNWCESESKSAISSPKIVTWRTTKSTEAFPTSEDLYENVSDGGMNYFENRLINIAKKVDVAGLPGSGGKRKIPKIEVRQEENKTVVKISIKDTPTTEEEMNVENRFKLDENVYENGYQNSNGFTSNVVYANCDKSDDEGGVYENVNVGGSEDEKCYENLSNSCYENVDSVKPFQGNPSENVGCFNRASKKKLITEANYCNLSGGDSKCDQVYNNREFRVSKNVVSIINKNSVPPVKNPPKREDGDDELYENVKIDCHIYSNENLCRNGEMAERYESRKTTEERKSSVVEVFLQKSSAMVKVEKPETEYADDNSSGDPFDSGTCSDVECLPNFVQSKKGNVIVTIRSLSEDKTDDKKIESGHRRAESLTSSGVGVDSEESDDEKSNISCDSLNSNDPYPQQNSEDHGYHTPNSEDKTESPIDQIEYENVIKRASENQDKNDIIQQVANASQKIRNMRMESTGVFTAKLVDPSEFEEYENIYLFDQPPKFYKKKPPPPPPTAKSCSAVLMTFSEVAKEDDKKTLPKSLLRDIRSRSVRLSSTYPSGEKPEGDKTSIANAVFSPDDGVSEKNEKNSAIGNKNLMVEERTYEERKSVKINEICAMEVDADKFYKFHLAENVRDNLKEKNENDEETFAGIKDYLCREKPAAITSAKGTIRGVKNRVKAGIATFLQLHENKSYKDRDAGKVVVYTTTMGIVRETYHKCLKVKQILRTLMIKFEERDVFMSSEAQNEIRDRMKCNAILVPQVFVEGQHIGDAETIERLNEMGELRTILKPYKSADACSTCKVCGGYRLLPCSVCKGSKKSIHRNHFTAEFVALKCMNCDQVGLTKCQAC